LHRVADWSGREVLLEVLRTEDVIHVFGNPGSTELPLIDALAAVEDLHYVLALQEATAVGMADGYAQATGRAAFLNLHTSAGLGNAIGNLTNARANGTPLVVTAGQQDERHLEYDPLLSGPLTDLAAPISKWSHEVRSLGELGTILRRAFHDAAAPPTGPVFVSLRMDILERRGDAEPPPPSLIGRRPVAGDLGALGELAHLLAEAAPEGLAIVVGDEVAASSAVDEAVQLAEALGAAVYGSPLFGSAVFPRAHPLWAGMLPYSATGVRATLEPYRRVLLVGGRAFMAYPYTPESPVPPTVELLHLSPDPAQLGRAHPVRLGLAGDPKVTLAALVPLVADTVDRRVTAEAVTAASARRRAEIESLEGVASSRYAAVPMDPMAAAHALVRALPPATAVVDEAITTGGFVRGFHHDSVPGGYFFCRGGGLGWGMPAACGVSLGRGGEPVLCVVGDGSALYSPQALWTAAHEQLPVVFAVVDNRQYRILKDNLRSMDAVSSRVGRFVAMDLVDPPVDFLALAGAFGVDSIPIESADEVGDAVRTALETGRPHLLHLPIAAP
jgi:benzoylformate decarboxylase